MERSHGTAAHYLTPVRASCLVLAVSMVVLGTALLSQYLGGLQPCRLCHYQRVPYVVVIGLSALALGVALTRREQRHIPVTRGMLVVCAAVFLAGAGVAAYHVGVEQHWWTGSDACTGIDFSKGTVEELTKRLQSTAMVRCDDVAWSMFGISMAGYNFLVSLLLAGAALWMAGAMAVGKKAD